MTQSNVYKPRAGTAWDSLSQLQRELNALFDGLGSPSLASTSRNWRGVFPPVNLYDTQDAYILMAELPGVEPDDIHVSLEDSTLSISGERKIGFESLDGVSLHRRERQAGSFKRAFELPAKVESEKVEAAHKNGVLMIRIPKSAEAQPRHIAVRAS